MYVCISKEEWVCPWSSSSSRTAYRQSPGASVIGQAALKLAKLAWYLSEREECVETLQEIALPNLELAHGELHPAVTFAGNREEEEDEEEETIVTLLASFILLPLQAK